MDIKNYFIEKGHGQPFIFLHGNGENCTYFKNQIDFFSERYHVYALDTRGHGKTPRGDKPFTLAQFAEDLYSFMEEQKIERAIILGFSDGGNIAMQFAMDHPEKVEKLILNGANLNARGVKRSVQIPIEIGYALASLFARKSPQARANAEMLGLMVNEPDVRPADLKKIGAPTLVIAGTKDMILKKHTELIARHITGARLFFIQGDHFIANKKPAQFNAAVEEFLD